LEKLAGAIGAEAPGSPVAFERVSTDSRRIEAGAVFFALSGERFDGNAFVGDAFACGACAAVTNVACAGGPCLVVADPLEALQQFAAWHRQRYAIPVLAVTGSCGKTTAKDLTSALLESRFAVAKTPGNLNNEIGCPLSLLQIGDDTGMAVIEMGANHEGEIAGLCALAAPTESAITMIAAAHLEGFGSIENVAKAKAEIVEGLPGDGVFYVNAEDEWCVRIAERFEGEKVFFGRGGDVVLEEYAVVGPGEARLRVAPVGTLSLPLACRAHATNVLLAIAVGLRHGVTEFEGPLRAACAAASRFKVRRVGPLVVMDDSYNANPRSMAAALEALAEWPGGGTRIAALGEMLELGEASGDLHRQIGETAGALGIAHVFAMGPHASDVIAGCRSRRLGSRLSAGARRSQGSPHAEIFDDPGAMAEAICAAAGRDGLVLVKGSRGIRMERVIEALEERLKVEG